MAVIVSMLGLAGTVEAQSSLLAAETRPGQSVDTTLIYAPVTPICTLTRQGPEQFLVNLETTSAQQVGDLTYVCNNLAGFSRTITSQNSGALVRGSSRIPYTFSHGGAPSLSLAPTALTAPVREHVAPFGAITLGESGSVSIAVPGSTLGLLAGAYEDVVTVAISAD